MVRKAKKPPEAKTKSTTHWATGPRWMKMELHHQIGAGSLYRQAHVYIFTNFICFSFTVTDIFVKDAESRDTFKCFVCTHEALQQSIA
jgi:hypothetical protein